MIKLGSKVRDRFTGFLGIVVGRAEYLSQDPRCEIASEHLAAEIPVVNQWFDEKRLEVLEEFDTRVIGFRNAP